MVAQGQNGGMACQGAPAETIECSLEECPTDCEWADWHPPGPCTKTCGGGTEHRHRAKVTEAYLGGAECVGAATEVYPCSVEPCAVDCNYDDWQPFTECTSSCGGGTHMTIRNYTQAMHGGIECSESNTSKEEECNTQACPVIKVKGGARQHHAVLTTFMSVAFTMLHREA